MSEALYDVSGLPIGGVRFWTPAEMQRRNWIKQSIVNTIERTLLDMNQMWRVLEVETPLMMPMGYMNAAYDENDVFILQNAPGGGDQDNRWALRAETTDGTYRIARHLLRSTSMKPPLCVYQSGKSFRRETSDGATAAKLRFNEFNQLEFQCIFGVGVTRW
jgi:histidyl-tRNA synthetase